MGVRPLELKEFARRVERMCDFFLAQAQEEVGRDGSNDRKILEDIREDAADIQFDGVTIASETITGLYDYMNGVDIVPEKKN